MFWKYTGFEIKQLFHNPKNLLIGLFLVLFFPLYFVYFTQTEPLSLKDQKQIEREMTDSIFNVFPETLRETPKGEKIYNNITEQSSLINFQRYYFWLGQPGEDYIRDGLRLNELRLELHELGNEGIPEYLIIPKEEILKEDARLRFIQDHNLPIETNIFVASNFLVVALQILCGLLFFAIVLISGSDLLLLEEKHRTVMFGFPISFMKKVAGKIMVHFSFLFIFLFLGIIVGFLYVSNDQGIGFFSSPQIIYHNGEFVSISAIQYIIFLLIGLALTGIFGLVLSVLLNQLFYNTYVNILLGLSIYLLSNLFIQIGWSFALPETIMGMNSGQVLSGQLSKISGNNQMDFFYSILSLLVMTLITLALIFVKNKWKYWFQRNNKEAEQTVQVL